MSVPSARRLIWISLWDLSLAMMVGSLIALPLFLVGSRRHHDRFSFSQMPPDDQALVDWARAQPGVTDVEVRRENGGLSFEYRSKALSSLTPAWNALGYTGLSRADLSTPYLPDVDASTAIAILVMCGQVGFLALGLRRIRAARRWGAVDPAPLGGPMGPALLVGLLTGVGLFAFGWAYGYFLQAAFGQSAAGIWSAIRNFPPAGKVAIIVVGGLVAPVCEEVFFRGGCYGSFAGAGHPRIGAWVSSIWFSLAHFNPSNAVAYAIYGLILVWAYRRSRSLLAPILAHAVNNTASFAFLIFSGG